MRTFYLLKVPIIDGITEVREVKAKTSDGAKKKAEEWLRKLSPGYNWILLTEHLYDIK
jgi:hypothetical protein